MSGSLLPPRLATRLLLSLYGQQRLDDVQQLQAKRKQLLTIIDNEDVTKPLNVDSFLHSSMSYETVQKVRRTYMAFLKEVTAVEAGNAFPNAAKTLFGICSRNLNARRIGQAEAVSYFGHISDAQFEAIWPLVEELSGFAVAQEVVKGGSTEFGGDIPFQRPDAITLDGFRGFVSTLDQLCGLEPATDAESSVARLGAGLAAAAKLTPEQEHRQSSRTWLQQLCEAHVSANSGGPFDAAHLANSIISACDLAATDAQNGEAQLQMALFDLVGETGFELMLEVIQQRTRIAGLGSTDAKEASPAVASPVPAVAVAAPPGADGLSAEDRALIASLTAADAAQGEYSGWEAGDAGEERLSANQRRKREQKQARALERALAEHSGGGEGEGYGDRDWLHQLGFDDDYLLEERALGLQKGRSLQAIPDNWLSDLAAEGTTQVYEKRGLPAGTERFVRHDHEEVVIPAASRPVAPGEGELVDVSSALEPWAQRAFAGTKFLNTIQSRVFPAAYHSFENMLVCAPTGAGKTNVAMLTLLQLVGMHRDANTGHIDKEAIKAVYIAPMKALAQEVVTKFAERLSPLGLVVREFTGDMQLTKQEVAEAQLLVCTPEKYDVVTRKGGDKSLGTLVSLVIIDEVHLLADERGAVIETIVARTQRYVEASQKLVRIVGLSATLPNYQDVASFLRVNPRTGLHYFGPEFRPIPLAQTFLGVPEKQRVKRNDIMNRLAYEKMVEALKRGKQVMIFVHARKETVKTAEAMVELSGRYCSTDLLLNHEHERYTLWKRQVDKSRSRELQQLFAKGLGVHHAGMLRADRTLTEQLFEAGLIKVLCCTATLAWGVNLPAHTVIIKGTELYDPERGGFVDLSILDVLQIFGRAGRPQYDTTGHAVLITPHKSLASYLGMLTNQAPIESALIKALPDHLNAEIVNGTVNNIKEAAAWLSYTFLFVRMCRNPLAYGLNHEDLFSDPRLEQKRLQLVREAADTLDSCMMCRYDKRSGNLAVTNLGRIASHYYIRYGTVEAFNTMLAPHLGSADALHVLCSSAEFDQLKVRPEELSELDALRKGVAVPVRTTTDDTAGKVNVLLQGYLTRANVGSFTLQSDTNYVAQNAGRITRALFEICLKRGWSTMANHYLSLCKSIDRRMLPTQSPLRQFQDLPREVLQRLEDTDASPDRLLDMTPREIGQLVHNQKLGGRVLTLAQQLPQLAVDTFVQPITRGILRLVLTLHVDFEWNDRYHGTAEAFWVWVEDGESEYIYHAEHVVVLKRERSEPREIEVTIPVREPLPPQYYVRVVSDSWVGCERVTTVSFRDLILPTMAPVHTDLLPVHPVPRSALQNPAFEALYGFSHFNPVQSQMFHTLYHTDANILVGAPTGSGKTITGELALLRLLKESPGAKCIYVAPLKALARERLEDWRRKFGGSGKGGVRLRILELTGDVTPTLEELNRADLLIVTPEKWDSITRGWQRRAYVQRVQLVIIDEIHLLGVDRGPVLEVLVSRMRFISTQTARPIRFVGLSTALANPRDLADWLGIGEVGVYNFRSSVRPVPLTTHIQGFPEKHYCPRMATMNKPAYAAIQEHSPHKPVLVFVASRRQTRLTALDLIAYCAAEENPKQFLHMPEDEIEAIAATLQDHALRDTIVFGVALHHAGLHTHDRKTVEALYLAGKVQVLVCTSTLAWGVNLPCHLVIVKGTEFFDAKQSRYVDMPVTDVLQMMGRAGRPQFDATGTACILVHEPKKTFYKKFLHEPFPVESSLHLQLHDHLNAEIATGSLHNVRDCIEYLTWTYYFRRLLMNPAYYGLVAAEGAEVTANDVEKHLVALIARVASDLCQAGCSELDEGAGSVSAAAAIAHNTSFSSTYLGKIASLYYLNHRTVGMMRTQLLSIDAQDLARTGSAASDPRLARLQLWQLLMVLCDAPEFSELPVRHCEDELNDQLSQDLSRAQGDNPTDRSSLHGFLQTHWFFDSPHCKAFLLLVAHMEGAALPISDYITDTKTVLDQVTRVLKAMIDIAAEEQLFDIVLRLLLLSQLLVQGVPVGRSELCQLPGILSGQPPSIFKQRGITKLRQLLRLPPEQLRQLAASAVATAGSTDSGKGASGNPTKGRGSKRKGGDQRGKQEQDSGGRSDFEASKKVSQFLQVCGSLPDLSVTSVSIRHAPDADMAGDSHSGEEVWSSRSDTDCKLRAGASYVVVAEVSTGRDGGGVAVVHSNRPHKPKQATWYLLAALSSDNTSDTVSDPRSLLENVHYSTIAKEHAFNTGYDLIALRQVGSLPGRRQLVQVGVSIPPAQDIAVADVAAGALVPRALVLVLSCDSVSGLDCAVSIPALIELQ